jgi:hypothetical protein
VRLCRRQIEKSADNSSALPVIFCVANVILFLACSTTNVDTHSSPSDRGVWDRCRFFSPYVLQLLASLASVIYYVAVLLVVIVPQLVPLKYVSTTLGAHKSVSSC